MHEYEIRILKSDGSCSAIIEQVQVSDHAAIRSAQKIAQKRPFEVWRGLDCIYGAHNRPPLRYPLPDSDQPPT